MNIRKITSLTALLAFTITLFTSVILFIVPKGRIAFWADWQMWGLTKDQWGSIHIVNGMLFLSALCLHIYYNWHPIISYFKNRVGEIKLFTRELNAASVSYTHLTLPTILLV